MDRDTEMEDVSDRRRNDSRERKPSDYDRDRRRSRSRDRDHRRRSPSRSPHRSHRHRSRSRSYDRYRDREGRDRDRDRHRSHREKSRSRSPGYRSGRDRERDRDRDYKRSPPPTSQGGPMNAPTEEAEAHAKVSVKENRVYCGNLTYNTTYKDLIDYMKEAGEVAFAEIFVTPAGQSKGCGIVEYADRSGVDTALKELGDKRLLGRPVFIREDRESEARFGATPVPGKVGAAFGETPRFAPRPFAGGFGGPPAGPPADFRQLFVGNLPYTATWQDMKDLFREAGAIIRADVAFFPDGRPKGTGIVVYENHEDAKNAIAMYNGYNWQDSVIQVRPDRFVGAAGFRGGRGGFAPRGAFGGRGAFPGARGGFGPGGPASRGGRNFTTDLYADYNGPESYANGGGSGPASMPLGGGVIEPSKQIMVRNLPWSTSNEDLVELFETTGQVVLAEILYDGTRSKGAGVVQFKEIDEGQQACTKFTGYVYGGRPLDVQFNDRWHRFADSAASGTGGAAA